MIATDFWHEERRSFTVTRNILCESKTATQEKVNEMERRAIVEFRSNDPAIGYNRWPKCTGVVSVGMQT